MIVTDIQAPGFFRLQGWVTAEFFILNGEFRGVQLIKLRSQQRARQARPELILIATGSEVGLAQDTAAKLREQGKAVRVVSMPSTDVFDAQSAEYKQQVLPLEVTNRIAIEAGIADYWYKYVGLDGRVVGMTTFGESAPAGELFKEFGFTVDNILEVADELLDA